MSVATHELLSAAERLHGYILKEHWNGQSVAGPDSGVRFNSRIGRFIKSYFRFLRWSDNYAYIQGQAYWILSNWIMAELFEEDRWKEIAQSCSNYVLSLQQPDGFWNYPNPEWSGRIATVEGCFGALGLLETFVQSQHEPFLRGAENWHRYLINDVGFQGSNDLCAVNYFANVSKAMVPNNTTLLIWNLAKLYEVTRDDKILDPCKSLIAWLKKVQTENGELPYSVDGSGSSGRPHFLCFQYNAFEFLDLVRYYRITDDESVWPVIERLGGFLSQGIRDNGMACYDCYHKKPEVIYYTIAVARALSQAALMGIGDFHSLVDKAYSRALVHQRSDGGFQFFSRGNYVLLKDQRSYPRNLSMILYHLLSEVKVRMSL